MSLAQKLNTKRGRKDYLDPRHYDLVADSEEWEELLRICAEPDNGLQSPGRTYAALHGMRCGGTEIVRQGSKYIMRPIIDERRAWRDQAEYDDAKNTYLMPYKDDVIRALDELGRRRNG